jgi:hypothetical protein
MIYKFRRPLGWSPDRHHQIPPDPACSPQQSGRGAVPSPRPISVTRRGERGFPPESGAWVTDGRAWVEMSLETWSSGNSIAILLHVYMYVCIKLVSNELASYTCHTFLYAA